MAKIEARRGHRLAGARVQLHLRQQIFAEWRPLRPLDLDSDQHLRVWRDQGKQRGIDSGRRVLGENTTRDQPSQSGIGASIQDGESHALFYESRSHLVGGIDTLDKEPSL